MLHTQVRVRVGTLQGTASVPEDEKRRPNRLPGVKWSCSAVSKWTKKLKEAASEHFFLSLSLCVPGGRRLSGDERRRH